MERMNNHLFRRLISFMISILLACGVLPVYAENDYGFTLTEKKLYLFPNSQSEISYSVEGDYTVSFEYSSGVDLKLSFEGNTVTASEVTGVGEYRVLIDDNQTENTIVFSVGPAPSQMGFSQETYYYKKGEGTIDSGLQLEPADSRYSHTSYAFEPAGILEVSEDDPHHFVMLGEGTVTVTASNTEFFDTARFIIKNRFLAERAESNDSEYNIELNQSLDNQFIFNPDGAPYEDDVIHYESDNPDIVSVDRESGTATGLHFGDAVITAYGINGDLGSYTVHVNGDNPGLVDFDPSFDRSVREGTDFYAPLTIENEQYKSENVRYVSLNPDIVRIDEEIQTGAGFNAHAVSEGTAGICVYFGQIAYTLTLYVYSDNLTVNNFVDAKCDKY